LLSFSRIGRRGIDLKPVDVKDVLRLVLTNLQASIDESGARISYEALPSIIADPSLLQQLFQNLIANAIKFRGPSAPIINVSAENRTKEWIFSVKDNGIGIASEHAETIFVIFRRLHPHEEYPGSGIGLSICKKIIEQHDGRIWVESEPGRGSTFKFTLPIRTRRTYDHAPETRN
jgi:light-regulated signal transduction histidine kinase (bacteriophytochrome)